MNPRKPQHNPGALIKSQLIKLGLTQDILATRTGYHKVIISEMINNKRKMSVRQAFNICRVLKGLTVEKLLTEQLKLKINEYKENETL